MISAQRLSKSYSGKSALVGLDLTVNRGEILGFLGPNGAGKTTTVKILTGLVAADDGSVSIAGFDLARQPLEAKQRLGYVPEAPKVYEALSAHAFLDIVAALHHLDPAVGRQRSRELLDLFQLGGSGHKRMRELSKGMRQKVVITAALLHKPEVLILDEPFDGVDASTVLVLKSLLVELAAQGAAILFSSHILDVAERICTRLCIIHDGRKVAEGTPDDLMRAYRVPSLDLAFSRLTGEREPDAVSADIVAALNRS